jgi:hypothetical protein
VNTLRKLLLGFRGIPTSTLHARQLSSKHPAEAAVGSGGYPYPPCMPGNCVIHINLHARQIASKHPAEAVVGVGVNSSIHPNLTAASAGCLIHNIIAWHATPLCLPATFIAYQVHVHSLSAAVQCLSGAGQPLISCCSLSIKCLSAAFHCCSGACPLCLSAARPSLLFHYCLPAAWSLVWMHARCCMLNTLGHNISSCCSTAFNHLLYQLQLLFTWMPPELPHAW